MHLTQQQLTMWAKQRRADAPRAQKRYEQQADAAEKLIIDRGCDCDPSYIVTTSADGTPSFVRVEITHSLICTAN